MMLKNICLIALAAVSLAVSQNPRPLWDTEKDFRDYEPKVLELIGKIAEDPLGPDAGKMGMIVNLWAVQAPHIGFTRNAKYLSELDGKYAYRPVLSDAYTFGEIRLKLGQKREYKETEIAAASLASMLTAYVKVKNARPDARNPVLEGYLELEKSGDLLAHFDAVKGTGTQSGEKELPARYSSFEYGIKIKELDGGKIKFKEWKKKDFLILYVSAGCPHCRDLVVKMKDSVTAGMEVVLLFSRLNSSGQIREFFDSTRSGFKAYHDFDAQFMKEYGGGIVPVAMVVKKDGSAIRAIPVKAGAFEELIKELRKL